MEDTEKKEQTPAQTPAQDEVPAPAPAPAEPQNGEAPAEEKKEDGCGGDGMAKLADALDAISKKLDSLLEAKAEPKADEKPVEEPKADEKPVEDEKKEEEKPVEGVSDSASLPQYTQSLSAVNAGYSLDDAFAKLKGRR